MKKFIFTIFASTPKIFVVGLVASFISLFLSSANAKMPAGQPGFSDSTLDWEEIVEHTAREEKEGKELWDKLSAKGGSASGGQAKEVACENLSDKQYGVLGEYFMGQMSGKSHAAMNAMMIQTYGEEGEEQIHIAMGKRLSGCDTSAAFSAGNSGWMPMMNMMFPLRQGFGGQGGRGMMDFGYGLGFIGWIFMILWWALIIIGIVALIKWLTSQSRGTNNHKKSASIKTMADKSALEILRERYAKGEIDKKEFEEKKKDLEV